MLSPLTLLIILAILGSLTSFLENYKDIRPKNKKNISVGTIWLLCIGFIITIFLFFMQDSESSEAKSKIDKIDSQLDKNLFLAEKQGSSLEKSMARTDSMIDLFDSTNTKLSEVLSVKETLLNESRKINDKLVKQIEFEKRAIDERSAQIFMGDNEVTWEKVDSVSVHLSVCLRNIGARNATVKSFVGYVLLIDRKGKVYRELLIPSDRMESTIPAQTVQSGKLCTYSDGLVNLKEFESAIHYAILKFSIEYEDVLDGKVRSKIYWKVGYYKDGFGGAREGAIKLATEWESSTRNK